MKKKEIKRRKRVVPAGPDSSSQAPSTAGYSPQPQHSLPTPVFESSVSPDPASIESREHQHQHHNESHASRGPVAVDFTDFYKNTNRNAPTSNPPPTVSPSQAHASPYHLAPSSLKRSFSAAAETSETPEHQQQQRQQPPSPVPAPTHVPHRSHDIPSLLNPTAPREDSRNDRIDPALANLGSRPRASPNPPSAQADPEKLARKEQLRRETERMREELARKEREMMELED